VALPRALIAGASVALDADGRYRRLRRTGLRSTQGRRLAREPGGHPAQQASDDINQAAIAAEWTDFLAAGSARGAARDRWPATAPPPFDMQFGDFIDDRMVRRIHAHFGRSLSDEAERRTSFLANPRQARHHATLAEASLDPAEERATRRISNASTSVGKLITTEAQRLCGWQKLPVKVIAATSVQPGRRANARLVRAGW
jgi:hypothetical protein